MNPKSITQIRKFLGVIALAGMILFFCFRMSFVPSAHAQTAVAPSFSLIWDSNEIGANSAIAWGDMNSDGNLDLAVGGAGAPIELYRNGGVDAQGKLQMVLVWSSVQAYSTNSLAWGDIDNDGDLDLAVGNDSQPLLLFRNDGTDAQGKQQMILVFSRWQWRVYCLGGYGWRW